jgi:hypothetical protein
MKPATTYFAVIEADHTIKAPSDLPVGERVMLVRVFPLGDLQHDPERQSRFAATRQALMLASKAGTSSSPLSDAEIVALVKRARQANRQS